LAEHKGEISSTQFEFTGEFCATGSIDRSCKIWDIGTGKCIETLKGHLDEVLDLSFNSTGTRLATASADSTARIYNVHTGACTAILAGTIFKIFLFSRTRRRNI
jgi:dynein assembly factor with WDR repeat domains 1